MLSAHVTQSTVRYSRSRTWALQVPRRDPIAVAIAVTDTHDPKQVPLDTPVPARWTVRAGRDAYLAENGFRMEDYDAPWTPASVLGLRFGVPNTPRHRRAIMQHDLHHVATGFGTDLVGEGEVSAWEARNGLGHLDLYVRSIVIFGVLMGMVRAPVRTWQAFRAARNGETLFALGDDDYAALLELRVEELRNRLGVPEAGLSQRPRHLHSMAPSTR